MAQPIRVAILGAGWPGVKHAEGYRAAGGFEVSAVADRIPGRRRAVRQVFPEARESADAESLLADPQIDAVSICLPNEFHAPLARAALKAGKHVICETPPTTAADDAQKLAALSAKSGKVLLYAAQRRFGAAEQAAAQAVDKGYCGEVYHARASWMRTRGIPTGTGWFTDRAKSGGGALIDLGAQMLDLAWRLLGQPRPLTVFAATHQKFRERVPPEAVFDVEDAAFALLTFEGGRSLELSASWAINQSPRQNGTACRVHGTTGAIEIYTPQGPVLFRNFDDTGRAKESPLKLPKIVLYPALMRHFRACIRDGAVPAPSADDGAMLMKMIEAMYKSAASAKSVEVRSGTGPAARRG